MRRSGSDGNSPPEMPSQVASDTTEEAARMQIELWRAMTPAQKLELASGLTVAVQRLCLAGIRMRHPEASERECFLRLAIIKLGRELAAKAYPETASISDL